VQLLVLRTPILSDRSPHMGSLERPWLVDDFKRKFCPETEPWSAQDAKERPNRLNDGFVVLDSQFEFNI
jgi:hypothetical protein